MRFNKIKHIQLLFKVHLYLPMPIVNMVDHMPLSSRVCKFFAKHKRMVIPSFQPFRNQHQDRGTLIEKYNKKSRKILKFTMITVSKSNHLTLYLKIKQFCFFQCLSLGIFLERQLVFIAQVTFIQRLQNCHLKDHR